jgi:hypothetical protein
VQQTRERTGQLSRLTGVRRQVIALSVALALTGVAAVGVASTASASTASAASHLTQQSQAWHRDALALLNGYLATYGSTLSPKERAHVTTLISNADAAMTRLDTAVKAISAATTTTAHRAAVAKALARFDAAKAAADAGVAYATPLLSSRMNVFEMLGAKRDSSRLMGELSALGSAIRKA